MYLITYTYCSLGCAIDQAVANRPVTEKIRVRSYVSPCEILGARGLKGKVFSPSVLGFSCQDHTVNIPYPSSSTCYSYEKDKWAKPGKLQKNKGFSEIWERSLERYYNFLAFEYSKSYMSADMIIKVVTVLQHVWGRREVYTGIW